MREKIIEWIKRYLPAEVTATITALIVATIAHRFTQNEVALAFIASWAEVSGFYVSIINRDLKGNQYKLQDRSIFRGIRNYFIEFGPAELLDNLVVRPASIYFFTVTMGNLQIGVILGKVSADLIFYTMAITGYEIRKRMA